MGLRKSGASREWDAVDTRFASTTNAMALAMRHQRMKEQSALAEDDEIKVLTQSLASGMRLEKTGGVMLPGPVLATILETTGSIEENSATNYILEGYLLPDDGTEAPDDEESTMVDGSAHVEGMSVSDTDMNFPRSCSDPAHEIRFVGWAPAKWTPKGYAYFQLRSGSGDLQPMKPTKQWSNAALPLLFYIGLLQYVSEPTSTTSTESVLPLFIEGGVVRKPWKPQDEGFVPIPAARLPLPARNKACALSA